MSGYRVRVSEEHKEHLAFLPKVDSAGQGARRRRAPEPGLGVGMVSTPIIQSLFSGPCLTLA